MKKNKPETSFTSLLELVGESANLKHRGLLPHADVTLLGVNESCGDKIILQLKLDKDGHIKQALFNGESCSLSALGAETMCALIEKGKIPKPIEEKVFLKSLNFNFSPVRKKCAYLVWKTWQNYVSSKFKPAVQKKSKK
ncbi:MAG TPA: iron-sulfur cluster assembly scaffold protein [Candidatus Paceibacterota bacterium]|nr:iron-sulfur cluster assembly scaffold protein [Candidatus Paceibacterota bacterium]